jgi:hypothetical protein
MGVQTESDYDGVVVAVYMRIHSKQAFNELADCSLEIFREVEAFWVFVKP